MKLLEELSRNQQTIHDKGFKFGDPDKYSKIKVGSKNLEDVVVDLSQIKQAIKHANFCSASKRDVLKAIAEHDLAEQRRLSNLFYDISGIYQKVCNTFAFSANLECSPCCSRNCSIKGYETADVNPCLNAITPEMIMKLVEDNNLL